MEHKFVWKEDRMSNLANFIVIEVRQETGHKETNLMPLLGLFRALWRFLKRKLGCWGSWAAALQGTIGY